MSWICALCGKKPVRGNTIVRHGMPKKKGGVGLKVGGISGRWFKPNLQRVRIMLDGKPTRTRICAACIKKGWAIKPPVLIKGSE